MAYSCFRQYLAAVVIIRADAVRQRRAHVVHAADRRHMVDRVARDWTLRAYDGTVGEIWDAYARRCPVTSQLLAGANTKWVIVPKAIDGVPVRWLNSHYLNVEPLVARTYGDVPPSLPFSHYRFAERARRFGRHDRLAKQLHKVIDTSGAVPRLADAAVSNLECGAACPTN